jgi:hypothetical protein
VCTLSGTYNCNTADEAKFGVNVNNCTYCAVISSWIYDLYCINVCNDANGIIGGFGQSASGPIKLWNNMIAAAGESWGSGGGGNNPPVPAEFEIRQNHSFKPASWLQAIGCGGQHPIVKNLGEFKNANRALFEGNELENSWQGCQSDQFGYANLFTPKNQSSFSFVTSSANGTNTITALSGSFSSGVVSPQCAVPNSCKVTYAGTTYHAVSLPDPTHLVLDASVPTNASSAAKVCQPGLTPNAPTQNITYRFNHLRNVEQGIQIATAVSDCNDADAGGAFNFSFHDNLLEGLNSNLANNFNPTPQAACFDVVNGQPPPTVNTFSIVHNTCAIVTAGSFSNSGLIR